MEIKILSPEEVVFKEKDIQTAFEQDLSKLEEGLELVASEVTIGTGRIDTLAYDSESSRPVFIEYKRRGEFDKDALIQLMDYLSWFARDENRMAILEKVMKQYNKEIEDFDPSIRLICVVTDIEDRVKNAIYAIANHVKVYSYLVAKDTAENVILVPKLEVDNSEVEVAVRTVTSEAELLKSHPHLETTFSGLKKLLEEDGTESYATGRSLRFKKQRVFAVVRFRKRHIQLELRAGEGRIQDDEFKYWRKGNSPWGYTNILPTKSISHKISDWIEMARDYASGGNGQEAEEDALPE
jgi:hypothetical protein